MKSHPAHAAPQVPIRIPPRVPDGFQCFQMHARRFRGAEPICVGNRSITDDMKLLRQGAEDVPEPLRIRDQPRVKRPRRCSVSEKVFVAIKRAGSICGTDRAWDGVPIRRRHGHRFVRPWVVVEHSPGALVALPLLGQSHERWPPQPSSRRTLLRNTRATQTNTASVANPIPFRALDEGAEDPAYRLGDPRDVAAGRARF